MGSAWPWGTGSAGGPAATGSPASERPIFLAALTTVCGIIPFAVPVLWGAAAAWLFITGHTVAGVALFVWMVIVVGWTDRQSAPAAHQPRRTDPFIMLLFFVLPACSGGLAAFGLVGPLPRSGHPRGIARGVARVAGRERPGGTRAAGLGAEEHAVGWVGGFLDVRVVEFLQVQQEVRALGPGHLDAGEHPAVVRAVVAVVEQRDVPA